MPDIKEVYEMVTKHKPPPHGALERQWHRQRRATRNRKVGALVAVAALMVAIVTFAVISNERTSVPMGSTAPPQGSGQSPAIVGLDGAVRQVPTLPADAWNAALSPDGTQVAYVTDAGTIPAGCAGP